ncbi:MAG TPA: L,D-transpeptidase family protein, partial [Hyphomicrobiaceae bacterium]|nr:L,D-transpeptidase family protein [Hyphomicrobiaceae bacterium]
MFTVTRSCRGWAYGLAIVLLAASTITAQAADGRVSRAWKGKRHAPAEAAKAERDKSKPPAQVHLAVVSLSRQRITLYGAGGFRTEGAVSTGMRGFPTPSGVFSILQKNRYHRSNIYSGAPMPFMQRITWSGVALHAGVLPGYPASHGCIRLTHGFAAQLWGMTKVGARVVVAPEDVAAVEIAHSKLPRPSLRPVQERPDAVEPPKPPVHTIAAEPGPALPSGNTEPELLAPLERARIERAR